MTKQNKNHSCDRKHYSYDAHSTPCNGRNVSCHMMKYSYVTRKTSCDRKNTSCDKRSIISVTNGFFPVKERITIISCDRNKKEHVVSQYIFPVNERICFGTGNTFPVKGRTKVKGPLVSQEEYFMAQEIYFL